MTTPLDRLHESTWRMLRRRGFCVLEGTDYLVQARPRWTLEEAVAHCHRLTAREKQARYAKKKQPKGTQ